MKLKDIKYETKFIWKHKNYTQVIRPKNPVGAFYVVCRPSRGQGEWIDMPAGRVIKPVVTAGISD